MKRSILILGLGAGVMLAAGSAAAGPCTAEIETLEKTLAATDAGMGPICGRPPACKVFVQRFWQSGRLRSYVRPVDAAG